MLHRSLASSVLVTALLLAASCADDSTDAEVVGSTAAPAAIASESEVPAAGLDAAQAALSESREVIDVRTPEEFDEGHVAVAALIDIQDPSFEERVGQLDPGGEYVVYCRSGNRSARAAAQMRELGLDVYDGGGLDTMLDAGWPAS